MSVITSIAAVTARRAVRKAILGGHSADGFFLIFTTTTTQPLIR